MPPQILVADDEQELRNMMNFILSRQGYTVIQATDGQEVLDIVRQNQPDLILLDVMMPKIDGIQVIETLKNTPNTGNIPIILISARGKKDSLIENCLQKGANHYVTKPVDMHRLINLVQELLQP